MTHWIAAPVVLPALLAALMVMAFRRNLAVQRGLSLAGTGTLALIAAGLMGAAATGAPHVYALGDWPAPFGIVLVLDRLAALMVLLTGVLAFCVLLYAAGTGWDARGAHFHALFQFQLAGLCGAFLTGDAFNLFVFFEVLLIASYGLMVHGGGAVRAAAGVRYVVVNLVGSALFLFALGTLYALTGTLNMADLAQRVAALPPGDAALLRVGAVLLMLVFALKAALVPLHFWLPGAYAAAPAPVAALFAVMTKVGAYAILRFATLVFPVAGPGVGPVMAVWLLPAALLTLALGSLGMLAAREPARLAACATIASMGTLLAAFGLFSQPGIVAGLYYMLHSTLAGAALFLVAGLTGPRGAAQSGLVAGLFMAAAVALAGLPPLSGFVGKLLVLDAARTAGAHPAIGWPAVWAIILAASLVATVAFSRAGSALFWRPDTSGASPRVVPLAAICTLVAALAGLTVFARPVTAYLTATAAQLYDPAAYVAAVLGASAQRP